MQMCFRNTYATGTQVMSVRIPTDTTSSLTMHFINQFSKQTRLFAVEKPDVH